MRWVRRVRVRRELIVRGTLVQNASMRRIPVLRFRWQRCTSHRRSVKIVVAGLDELPPGSREAARSTSSGSGPEATLEELTRFLS